jgi:hypothetical protein
MGLVKNLLSVCDVGLSLEDILDGYEERQAFFS